MVKKEKDKDFADALNQLLDKEIASDKEKLHNLVHLPEIVEEKVEIKTQYHDEKHAMLENELIILRRGRTEDNVGMSEKDYWDKRNELHLYLNSLKGD